MFLSSTYAGAQGHPWFVKRCITCGAHESVVANLRYDEQIAFFKDSATAEAFAMQNVAENLAAVSLKHTGTAQECGVFKAGQADEQNDPTNCGKLNMAPVRAW